MLNWLSVIRDNLTYFQAFDKVIIYYDNGQVGVNKILSSVFNVFLENVECVEKNILIYLDERYDPYRGGACICAGKIPDQDLQYD